MASSCYEISSVILTNALLIFQSAISVHSQAMTNLTFCGSEQYCIGESCDLTCKEANTRALDFNTHLESNLLSAVDIENSKECVFFYPLHCEKCKCVARSSPRKSQNALKSCQPCQFKSVGWLRRNERDKCAPEICPLFFPISCGMSLISADDLGSLTSRAFPKGLWIHLLGDSLLRGIFVHAVSYLTIRSKHIEIFWNLTTNAFNQKDAHLKRYVCCSARHTAGIGEIDRCELHKLEGYNVTPLVLVNRVAAEIVTRRSRGETPICVSFAAFNVYLKAHRDHFDELGAAFAATGALPAAIVTNPGIWELLAGFDLHELVEKLRLFQAGCTALVLRAKAGGANLTCAFMTTADTAYPDADAARHKHRRLHHNIQGYNAAVRAAWLDGGMPLVDAGALSLHPAVINSIDADKLHYGRVGYAKDSSPANPFSSLCWQAILHTVRHGAHPCEAQDRAAGPAPDDASESAAESSISPACWGLSLLVLLASLQARGLLARRLCPARWRGPRAGRALGGPVD